MTVTGYERNVVTATTKYDVVGTRPIRHDGADKVTGRALYGADFWTAGLLHGKILRSPHSHARIKSVDTSKAEAFPGVRAVVTGNDLWPETMERTVKVGDVATNVKYLRDNIMAKDKVLYQGHPVAGIAAVSPHVAEEALELIDVEYEILPSVLTVLEAMQDDAPLLHDDLETEEFGAKTGRVSNVAVHFQHKLGNIEKGFAEADIIVEREFNTATVHQGYIEPHNTTAYWNKDGRLHIWLSTQSPFDVKDTTAEILGIPESQVRLTPMEIGGGFGGKYEPYGDPIAALLSKKTGQAVKIVMTRTEEFESTGPTPGSYIKIKIGTTIGGKITAAQAYLAYEAGAYPGSPVSDGSKCVLSAYDIPNLIVDGFDTVVNKPKTGAYRAPGATNAAFATETVLDELAERLGLDPIQFRLNNASKEGARRADGPRHARIGCVDVLKAMKNHPHYSAPLEGENQGRGTALGFWYNGGGESNVNISVHSDGTINLIEGSPDIGGTRASIAMQAAEVLGISAEDVRPSVVDTDSIGFTSGTGGSSVTFKAGWAAYKAAHDIKRQLIERAAMIWDVKPDSIELRGGAFNSKTDPKLQMTFKELAGQLNETGGPIVGRGAINPSGGASSFAGNIVDVEVDPETGKVTILRFTAIQDVGKAIHPSYVEGQIQGGSVQGIGWGLNEEYFYNEAGQLSNSSFLDYRIPITLDLPMIDTVIVEVPSQRHPFGVRGVGEASIIPPPAAIANAIYAAIGVRMDKLPMNPGAVMEASWKHRG